MLQLKKSCRLAAILSVVALSPMPIARDGAIGDRQNLALLGGDRAGKEPIAPAQDDQPAPAEVPADLSPAAIAEIVEHTAPEYQVDPKLVLAVIATESSFNAKAVSSHNAQGLMQLMPGTAERFGVRDALDPVDNIRGGIKYLRWLLADFRGDLSLVLAAYNSGENAVHHWRGVPPQSRSYLRKVRRLYRARRHPYALVALNEPALTPSGSGGGAATGLAAWPGG